MTATRHPLRRKAPALIGGIFLLVFTALVVWLVVGFIGKGGKPEAPRVQKISLVKPPPPKPPEEKPPEPKKVDQPKDEVKVDQPKAPPPDAPPPPGGIAEGPANGMQTDLAAGSGLGIGGGALDAREAWYGREIARYLEGSLRNSKRLKNADFSVTVNIWFTPSGNVTKVQMVRGSGDAATDAAIREELMASPPMRDAFPDDLRQPVNVRLASRA